jgi:hypothetical protein
MLPHRGSKHNPTIGEKTKGARQTPRSSRLREKSLALANCGQLWSALSGFGIIALRFPRGKLSFRRTGADVQVI